MKYILSFLIIITACESSSLKDNPSSCENQCPQGFACFENTCQKICINQFDCNVQQSCDMNLHFCVEKKLDTPLDDCEICINEGCAQHCNKKIHTAASEPPEQWICDGNTIKKCLSFEGDICKESSEIQICEGDTHCENGQCKKIQEQTLFDDTDQSNTQPLFLTGSLGHYHSCFIKNDNTLWCFGSNDSGQLGMQTNESTIISTARQIDKNKWIQVSAGFFHTCAIQEDYSLWCWGKNVSGSLGIGSDNFETIINTPVKIGKSLWKHISVGALHTCGIQADQSLWCWGNNQHFQIGLEGKIAFSSSPNRITTLLWNDVSCGIDYTCAIRNDNTLWCFGNNADEKISVSGHPDLTKIPITQVTYEHWKKVSVQYEHSCAVNLENQLFCFGKNTYGQIRFPASSENLSFVYPELLWNSVYVGFFHSCGLTSQNELWCWGLNESGQIGENTATTSVHPVKRIGDKLWKRIFVGSRHTCAFLESDSSLWCWGNNTHGQLGIGTTDNVSIPQLVITSTTSM